MSNPARKKRNKAAYRGWFLDQANKAICCGDRQRSLEAVLLLYWLSETTNLQHPQDSDPLDPRFEGGPLPPGYRTRWRASGGVQVAPPKGRLP